MAYFIFLIIVLSQVPVYGVNTLEVLSADGPGLSVKAQEFTKALTLPRFEQNNCQTLEFDQYVRFSDDYLQALSSPSIFGQAYFESCALIDWVQDLKSHQSLFALDNGQLQSLKVSGFDQYYFNPLSGKRSTSPDNETSLVSFIEKLADEFLRYRGPASVQETPDSQVNYYSVFTQVCELLKNCHDMVSTDGENLDVHLYLHRIVSRERQTSYRLLKDFEKTLSHYHFSLSRLELKEGKNPKIIEAIALKNTQTPKSTQLCLGHADTVKEIPALFALSDQNWKDPLNSWEVLSASLQCTGHLEMSRHVMSWRYLGADGLDQREVTLIQKQLYELKKNHPYLNLPKNPSITYLRQMFARF